MAVAKLLLKNDVGLVLDITESPLACTVYDLEGNVISGGGDSNMIIMNGTLNTETYEVVFDKTYQEVFDAIAAGTMVLARYSDDNYTTKESCGVVVKVEVSDSAKTCTISNILYGSDASCNGDSANDYVSFILD